MPIPENLKQEVEAVLSHSSLSEEDKTLWRERLSGIAEAYTDIFLSLFSEDQSGLPKETERLKAKIAAGGDPEKLAKIAEEEYNDLLSILQKETEVSDTK